MNNQAIGELVRAYIVARHLARALNAKEAAGMFIVQYGIKEATRQIRQVAAGAKEGFWHEVLTHLEGALAPKEEPVR